MNVQSLFMIIPCFLFRKTVRHVYTLLRVSLVAQLVKNLPDMQETLGWIPGSERSPGEGNGNSLQWRVPWTKECEVKVHGVAKSWT